MVAKLARKVFACAAGRRSRFRRAGAQLSLIAPCVLLFSCTGPTTWMTTLRDGQQFQSTSFPKLDESSGLYNLVDSGGEAHVFHENQVASIVH